MPRMAAGIDQSNRRMDAMTTAGKKPERHYRISFALDLGQNAPTDRHDRVSSERQFAGLRNRVSLFGSDTTGMIDG